MSGPQPTAAVLADAGNLLRGLSSALQTHTLYGPGHPLREEVVETLLKRMRRLQDAEEAPVIFVSRHSFYFGSALLARESLALFRLLEAFEQRGVEAVELLPGVSAEDVHGLIEILLGRRPADAPLSGITINRLRPTESPGDEEERVTELRRGYAAGLELLRVTAARISEGRPADLEGTRRLVEYLADMVARDPEQALLLTAVKSYDEYTYYHMMNVCLLTLALGQAVGLTREQIVALGIGALLHDVGKVNVPQEILQHVGALSEEQWRLVQRHPVDGAGFIFATSQGMAHPAAAVVLEHHAAYDLGGYPGLAGREHPAFPACMVAVADCFDAVTSKRTYRKAADRRQALEILQAASGRGFHPLVVRAFVRLLGLFPVGSLVRLSTGEVGVVIRNHPELLARPTVRLVLDAGGSPAEPVEVDVGERAPDGRFRRSVEGTVDPRHVGVDMTGLVSSGALEEAGKEPEGSAGLVHEPSFGEPAPPGYVDAHGRGGDRREPSR